MTGFEKIISRIPEDGVLIFGVQGEYWTDIARFSTAEPKILSPVYNIDALHAELEDMTDTDFSAVFIAWGLSALLRDRDLSEMLFDRLKKGGSVFAIELLNDAQADAPRQNHRNFLEMLYQSEILPKNRIVSVLKSLNITQIRTFDALNYEAAHVSEDFFSLEEYAIDRLKQSKNDDGIIENIKSEGIAFAPFMILQGFQRDKNSSTIGDDNITFKKSAALAKIEDLRREIFQFGTGKIDDAGLLSIALDCDIETCEKILRQYGGKSLLKEKNIDKLSAEIGIEDVKTINLTAILELGRRLFAAQDDKVVITSPEEAVKILDDMRELRREQLRGLYLDNRGRLVWDEVIAIGSLNKALAPPREILAPALEHDATGIIIAHNHPSGIAEPSGSDEEITDLIESAANLMKINLWDHIIITKDGYYSFNKAGKIKTQKYCM